MEEITKERETRLGIAPKLAAMGIETVVERERVTPTSLRD